MWLIQFMLTTKIQFTSLLITGIICFLCNPQYSHAGLNKWVDDKGNTHYGDRVPPSYLKKEHSQLNEQGITVSTTKAQKTEEELNLEKKKLAIKTREDTKRRLAEHKQQLHDRMLLDTFTTEADLVHAIEARVETVNSQIALAETLIKNDEQRLKDIKLHIKTIESSGRKPPENLHKEIITIGRQLEKNFAYIEDRANERDEILKIFEKDVKRYRELTKRKLEAKKKARERKQQGEL